MRKIPNTVGRFPGLPQGGGAGPCTPDVGAAFFPRAPMEKGQRGSSQENPLITLETLVTNPPLTVLHTAARGVETARHCVRAEAGMGSPEMNSEWSDTCYPVSLWGCWRLCGSPERGKSVDLGSQGRCLWEEALSCPPPSLPYPPTMPSPSSPPPPGPPATTKAAAFPPQLHSW